MTKAEITIRPVRREDRAAWERLWTAYLEFYEAELPRAVYDTSFERLLSGSENEFHGLIAEQGGQAIGLVHYVFHRTMWSVNDTCYLQDLFVDDAYRGTGAGRALIEAVYAAADSAGASNVYWLTQDFNTIARRLYDRIGVKTPFIRYDRG